MNRAIAYAEDTVGVHRTWLQTQDLATQLNDLYQTRASLEASTRQTDWEIDCLRNEVFVKESTENSSMNVTAFERHMKLVYADHEDLRTLGKARIDLMAHRDAVEAQIKSVERNSNGHIARLKELGGYFEYLAVVKASQMQVVQAAQAANESPW